MKSWRIVFLIVTAVLSLTTRAHADLSTGVVSYWPLDQINGNTSPDYGSSNVLITVGTVSLVAGESPQLLNSSNAFSFPASPVSYFTTAGSGFVPTGLPIYKSAAGYTVALWVKAPAQTTRYLYTETSNTANQIFGIGTGTTAGVAGKIDLLIRNDAGSTLVNHTNSVGIVFDNTWHYVAFTDNHGVCVLYVDGNVDTNFTYHPAGNFSLSTSTIGNLVRNTLGAALNGTIDNVAVWGRPLSQAEVQDFMTNSIPLPIVQSKPSISSISPDSTNALGEYVVLNVGAVGSNPITNQWLLNGTILPGQTSNSLLITTLTNTGTYLYSVICGNFLGAITNTITITVPADPANNITNGLISYWPLDNISNSTFVSTPDLYSRNDFILGGTSGATPNTNTGVFAGGLAFDGSQLEFARANGGVPVFNNTNYTVSLWVNGQPGAQLRVFAESSTNFATPLFTIATDPTGFLPNASIFLRNDANVAQLNNRNCSASVFDGAWHHLVWVDQNGHALLYVDGVLDPVSFSYVRTGTYSLNTTAIGAIVRATTGNCFTGGIDDVAMWNRRLTYSEIIALQSSTIPPATQILPPFISAFTITPTDPTNNLYAGDNLTLSTQVGGTVPLTFQWFKDGQPIAAGTTGSLSIPNTQTNDSGAYSLTISNGDPILPGGTIITSKVVQVTVQGFVRVTNGLALALDVDALGSPNTEPGFQMYNSSLFGTGFTNAVKVTITNVGTSTVLADRLRATPPNVVVNGPGMTQAQLYNDFLFCNVTNANTGLTITLDRLAPNTPFGVTIWSFDPSSIGTRISDWTELSSGTPIVIKTGYSFNGSVLPVADYDDTLGGLLTSSATGTLQIQALNDPANTGGVASFINAIQLVANPVITITGAAMALDGNFQISVHAQYPGQPVTLQYSPDLTPGSWQPVTTGFTTASHGPNITFEIPLADAGRFFRAVATH